MNPIRKIVNAALLMVVAGYYSEASVVALSECSGFRESCYGDGGTFYYWGSCWINGSGQTCGYYSCGDGGGYGSPEVCCWSDPVGCYS